ncbi:nose resistant to fluoxetine protein 6-like [Dendronephthya gigantea]|uniref:nose resistant to fluoxetine protein 6-like n=1 Tax=Dendronephthya gigantea TaxID=151771 RepID=UPI00106AA8B0|nr:nose resistant to fluoxetine protein 6-like [Dendronephthya gigantea]
MNTPLVSGRTIIHDTTASKGRGGVFLDFLRCFSLVRNTTKIFSTNVPPKVITSINGLRVISMFWVILGHTFLFMLTSYIMANPVDLVEDTSKFSMMVIMNGYFCVDTFFFLSGLLVSYTCFRKLEKSEGKFNWFLFYFHRYVRLTPSMMFVILFYVKLTPFLAYSPTWTLRKNEHCQKYWWTNLIYINNFYPTKFDDECVGWTWYLANDMQFYIISPFVLILAHRFGRVGLLASAGSLFMVSTIALASIYGHYNIDPLALSKWGQSDLFNPAKADFTKMVYDKPYCRIQPYLIGMMLGYFIHKSYSGTRKPNWFFALIAWLAAIAIGITLVYAPHDATLKDGRAWKTAENVIYGMFSKAAWGVALAWVVYACHYGFGGLIQRFLSARFWIPLSRLTYSTYLVHPIVLTYIYSSSKTTLYYDTTTVTFYFITAVVLSYACAFILSVVTEFPCDNLENFAVKLFGRKKRLN